MTIEDIQKRYGVKPLEKGYANAFISSLKKDIGQNDAAVGQLANETMAISQACQAAKKALQKAAKYTNDPRLKILQPRLQAAFNAIDAVSGGATAINHGKVLKQG